MREKQGAAADHDCMGTFCARQARTWRQDGEGYWYALCDRHAAIVDKHGVTLGPTYGA